MAPDGGEGLWFARENEYDVILLDIMLPVLNGYKVCEQLRAEGNWTPILMLTAKDGSWDQVEALDTGADDYVTKPFSFEVLLARVRSLLRRGVGRATRDPARRRPRAGPRAQAVTRAGEPVRLTARELSLLEFLMRRAGDVLTKQQILGNVWNFDFEGDPNIVEVLHRPAPTQGRQARSAAPTSRPCAAAATASGRSHEQVVRPT